MEVRPICACRQSRHACLDFDAVLGRKAREIGSFSSGIVSVQPKATWDEQSSISVLGLTETAKRRVGPIPMENPQQPSSGDVGQRVQLFMWIGLLTVMLLFSTVLWTLSTVAGIKSATTFYQAGPGVQRDQVMLGAVDPRVLRRQFGFIVVALVTALAATRLDLTEVFRFTSVAEGGRRRFGLTDGRRRIVGGAIGAVLIYLGIVLLSQSTSSWFTSTASLAGVPVASVPAPSADFVILLQDFVEDIFAGVWEEITLLAIPVALMTSGGWGGKSRFVLILLVVIALRVGIHYYYGWTALFVPLWMVGALLLFRAVGRIWPLVIAHIVFDMVLSVMDRVPGTRSPIVNNFWVVGALAAGVAMVSVIRVRTSSRRRVA